MADLTGPFDGPEGWSQTEWYNFAPTWAPPGIIGSPAASIGVGDFAVTASGLTVTVTCNGDRAWIDGSGYKPDTDKTLTVTANGNASLSRRDRLVIRRDLAAQTIDVTRLPGTPAGTPAPPALTQVSGGVWETPICSFLVPPASGTTLTGFIDERGWLPGGSGDLEFLTAAARDAHFPSPGEGQRCLVAGYENVYRSGAWQSFTSAAPSSYGSPFAANTLRIHRDQNGMGFLSGMILTATTITDLTGTWFTLPVGFRPTALVYGGLSHVSGIGIAAYQISTAGVVTGIGLLAGAYPIPAGRLISFSNVFPVA